MKIHGSTNVIRVGLLGLLRGGIKVQSTNLSNLGKRWSHTETEHHTKPTQRGV